MSTSITVVKEVIFQATLRIPHVMSGSITIVKKVIFQATPRTPYLTSRPITTNTPPRRPHAKSR